MFGGKGSVEVSCPWNVSRDSDISSSIISIETDCTDSPVKTRVVTILS